MSLLFMDGFDHYGAISQITRKWSTGTLSGLSLSTNPARHGGKALAGVNGYRLTKVVDTASSTCIFGIALHSTGDNSLDNIGFYIYEAVTGCYQATIGVGVQTSTISVSRGLNSNMLGSAVGVFPTDAFFYLEVKYVISNVGTGSVEARINGQSVINVTNVSTRGNTFPYATTDSWGSVEIRQGNGTAATYLDDFYLLDGAGTSSNDFWGDTRIDAHYPIGAGNKAQWTPSAGANYQNVDEGASGPDDDTTRNSTATTGNIDTFEMANLVNAGGTIRGVQVLNCVKKDNAGPCTVRNVLRIGSTDYEGSDFAPSAESYVYDRDIYDKSPATNLVWDETEFNNMEAGYKRQS